jgi:predicted nucleic acid-binding protein
VDDQAQPSVPTHPATAPPTPPLEIVLDTNVVLDWLAFGHPVAAAIDDALTSGSCRWLCTSAMRDELAGVVVRDSLRRWSIDAAAVLAVFDRLGVRVAAPSPLPFPERLRCSDPDDQPFIDLAIARRVHALLTRDRAVLRLASRARRFGVIIATPENWLRARHAGASPSSSGAAKTGGATQAPALRA